MDILPRKSKEVLTSEEFVLEITMKLPSKIKFVDEALKEAFEQLKEGKGEERKLYDWLVRAFNDIEQNAFCGIQIPKEYLQNVHNVWKYNLPNAWRLIYSIEHQEIMVVSIILSRVDEPQRI